MSEAVIQWCSVKNMFLEISQNLQENACARVSFLIKLQAFHRTPLVAASNLCSATAKIKVKSDKVLKKSFPMQYQSD